MSDLVTLGIAEGIASIALNAPDSLNALSPLLVANLRDAVDQVALAHERVGCLVITGRGRAFCAGANLIGITEADASAMLEGVFHPLLRQLRDLPMPVVTVVNGPAVGAGMSLALMGDIVLCSRSAYFLQAFRNIGLVPDCGSTWLLPRLVGRARAMEMSLMGERVSADTALAWGLVNAVHDDAELTEVVTRYTRRLADGPGRAMALTRRLHWESLGNSFEDQLTQEALCQNEAMGSVDFQEGVAAFLAKRTPRFMDRS